MLEICWFESMNLEHVEVVSSFIVGVHVSEERFKHTHLHDTHAIDLPSSCDVLDFKASVEL